MLLFCRVQTRWASSGTCHQLPASQEGKLPSCRFCLNVLTQYYTECSACSFGVKCVTSPGSCLLWQTTCPCWDAVFMSVIGPHFVCVCVYVQWPGSHAFIKLSFTQTEILFSALKCVCVCFCAEPALDGSWGFHPVYSLLGEGRHVQLRPLSMGAAHWRDSLRSPETWSFFTSLVL